MRELLQTRNRAFGPNGVSTTSRQTSATRTDTTSRLPISLGSTNKRYEPSIHLRPAAIIRPWHSATDQASEQYSHDQSVPSADLSSRPHRPPDPSLVAKTGSVHRTSA